jgi:hypothetical protein
MALVGIIAALSVPSAKLLRAYPVAAANLAAKAAGTDKTVYASEEFADWLLWERPELAGRVAFDVRYELLRAREVRQIVLFDLGSGVDRPLAKPDVFLLDPKRLRNALDGLRPTVRTVYKTDHAMVAIRRDDSG